MTTAYPPAGAPAPFPTTECRVRYGQLLYTSFDDESGAAGGWQVKDQNGDLTAQERELLTARVVTKFDVDPALPQFPTAEQIANRPARLAYAATGPGAAALWHTVDAGNDATGRPGNVMGHIVLDRDIAGASPLRPIQLWNSADWRRPYGPAEVLATTLDSAVPQPNPEITAAAAVHFLIGTSVDRQGVFRVLLDAVYAAMTGGPKVVLLTADNASAPLWISAVSYFMSPGTARRFSWTTHDKPPQAVIDIRRGMHLVMMPCEAATSLPVGDSLVVLDERDEPAVRELGSMHSASTAQIAVTPWSTLAEGVLADETMAVRLISDQDDLAEEVGDRGLSPIWPLAVAVSRRNDLSEFHRDAQHAIAEEAPAQVTTVGWLNDLVAVAAMATAPATFAEARDRLVTAADRGAGIRHAAKNYLLAAAADPANGEDPLTGVPAVQILPPSDWRPALERLWSPAATPDGDLGARALHRALVAAELLVRLAEPGPAAEEALATIAGQITATQLDVLYGSAGPGIVSELRGISVPVREAVLRPALAASAAQRDLRVLSLPLWQWVFGDENVPVDQQGHPPANPGDADRVLYPWYARALLVGVAVERIPAAWRREIAGHAVFMAVDNDSLSDERCRSLVSRLVEYAGLDAAEIIDILTRWPQRVSPGCAISTVLYGDCPPELLSLIAASHVDPDSTDTWGRCAIAGARLRGLTSGPVTRTAFRDVVTDAAPTLVQNLDTTTVGNLKQAVVDALIAACIAAEAAGQEWVRSAQTVTAALRQRIDTAGGSTAATVAAFVDAGLIDAGWIAGEAFLVRFGDSFGAHELLGQPKNRPRDKVFGDEIVSLLIERRSYDGPRDVSALRDSAWPRVRQLPAAQAEQFFNRYPKLAKEWLHDHRL